MLLLVVTSFLFLSFCFGFNNVTQRIVGGQEVGWDRYPYFGLLETRYRDGVSDSIRTSWCGSVLIAKSTLLTAAHCLLKPNIDSVSATIGMYDREKDLSQQIVRAKSWVLHPFYDSTKARNDIAIVRLQEIASVRPVSLSFDRDFPKPGVITNVFGYGTKSANENELSDKLIEIALYVLDTSKCQDIYGANNVVNVTQICAGGAGKVPCAGDSGGPMVVKGFFGDRDKLAGIVSFGGKDCNQNPALFTRVSAYRQWLEERICRGSPSEDDIPDWCPLTQNPINKGASQRPVGKRPSSPIKADVTPRPRPPNASGKQTSPPRLYPTSKPVSASTTNCFSGSNTVDVRERGTTLMKDLKIGDWVKTYHDRYEPVYSFGHWKPDAKAVVLEFKTTQSTLRLTRDHIMFKKHHQPLPASDIRVGDILMDGFGDTSTTASQVVAIRHHVQDLGLFAPFTPSGTLLVNGILVSSYVTIMPYQNARSMTGVGGNERVLLHKLFQVQAAIMNPHWLSHAALFPRRIRCYFLGSNCQNESYTSDGINTWDNVQLQYTLRILKWNYLARNVFLFIVVVLALLFTVIETGIQFLGVFPCTFLLIIAMATVVIWFIRTKRL